MLTPAAPALLLNSSKKWRKLMNGKYFYFAIAALLGVLTSLLLLSALLVSYHHLSISPLQI